MTNELASKWVATINAVLLGWNVAMFVAFLVAVVIGVVFANTVGPIRGAVSISVTFASAALVGIVVGCLLGRKVRGWFAVRTSFRNYIWLAILLVTTVLSMPAPFKFGVA